MVEYQNLSNHKRKENEFQGVAKKENSKTYHVYKQAKQYRTKAIRVNK